MAMRHGGMLLALAAVVALPPPAWAAASQLSWTSNGFGFKVDREDLRVTRGGEEIFSARKIAAEEVATFSKDTRAEINEALGEPPDERKRRLEQISGYSCHAELKPLSVVGSWVSYSYSSGGFSGGAHPYAFRTFVARDLERPAGEGGRAEQGSLLDLFSEEDVVEALAHDPFLAKRLSEKKHFDGIDDLVQALSPDCEFSFDKNALSQFAFHHLEGNKVAVRIGLSHGCEASRGNLTQLGILLPIPPALADALAKADRREEGFLMKDVKQIGQPAYSRSLEGSKLVEKVGKGERRR